MRMNPPRGMGGMGPQVVYNTQHGHYCCEGPKKLLPKEVTTWYGTIQ